MLNAEDVIRAWKDDAYRSTLSTTELASLPPDPAGALELDDAALGSVAGGRTEHIATLGCCGGFTTDPGFCSALCGGGGTLPCCGGPEPTGGGVGTMC